VLTVDHFVLLFFLIYLCLPGRRASFDITVHGRRAGSLSRYRHRLQAVMLGIRVGLAFDVL
jgi:hypothetical protein